MTIRNNQRALKVIRLLRSRQRGVTDKIDILCKDIVAAHSDFSTRLSNLNFAAAFYELLLDCTDLEETLDAAIGGIQAGIEQSDAAIILLADNGFDVHLCNQGFGGSIEKSQFYNWFTRELVNSISQMNRICTLEQLLRMGMQGPPAIMKTVSAAAVPLGRFGQAVGLVLVYRPANMPLSAEELSRAAAVTTGLRKAILSHLPMTRRSCSSEPST